MREPCSEESPIPEDWYAGAFGAVYPIIYAHRSVESAAGEAAFAIAQTAITPADRVLDLCCGNGRHLAHLVKSTRRLAGVDYSPELLGLARKNAPGVCLVRSDMRALPFSQCFDVVVNFFTSFGYFHSDAENMRVLRAIHDALRPAGRFFMDYLNPAHVAAHLTPHSSRESQGHRIEERRWIDQSAHRVNKMTQVFWGDACVARTAESVRLYALEEMQTMLAASGLEVDRVCGNYDGAAFSDSQPRMIIAGHRGNHGA